MEVQSLSLQVSNLPPHVGNYPPSRSSRRPEAVVEVTVSKAQFPVPGPWVVYRMEPNKKKCCCHARECGPICVANCAITAADQSVFGPYFSN